MKGENDEESFTAIDITFTGGGYTDGRPAVIHNRRDWRDGAACDAEAIVRASTAHRAAARATRDANSTTSGCGSSRHQPARATQ
jgi:hypothetical protein